MKRLVRFAGFFVILLLVFGLSSVNAGEKTATFTFEKQVLEADLAGFTLQYSSVGGEGTAEADWHPFPDVAGSVIPFVAGQHDYMIDTVFTSPDGQSVQYWFRVDAFDTSGNHSVWCYGDENGEPATVTVDFEGPEGLFNLKVIIQSSS